VAYDRRSSGYVEFYRDTLQHVLAVHTPVKDRNPLDS
jgi:hypothetical protein